MRNSVVFVVLWWTLVVAPWGAAQAQSQQTDDPVIAVGVIDVGTDAPVNVVGGFNFVLNNEDLSDQSGSSHGSTVSLIIDSAAPGIPQFQYVAADGDFNSTPAITDAAILTAANNPDVRTITISSGVTFTPSSAVTSAAAANKFVAIRAGNSGNDNPNILSVASAQLPGVVIVAATDGAGGPLVGSNNCGITAGRCVRTIGTTGFSQISGTSFASARMAGIAAEVLRSAPFLTAEELVQVIFATAEDLGDPGIDPVYGNGFVRDAAQVINNPAGPTQIAGGDGGGSGSLAVGALLLGVGAGAALLFNNNKKLKKTLVLDSFGRPFWIDLTHTARIVDSGRSIAGFFSALDERYGVSDISLTGAGALQFSYTTRDSDEFADPERLFALDNDPAFSDRELNWSFSLQSQNRFGFEYELHKNVDPLHRFGALQQVPGVARGGAVSFLSGQSFTSPFLGFAGSGDSAALGYSTRHGFGLKFGVVAMDESTEFGRKSVAAVLEGDYEFDDHGRVAVQVGRLNEAGSLFGGSSGGAFSVADTETYAVNLSGSVNLSERLSLIANYGVGHSEVDENDLSLLQNFSAVRSNWFGVGLLGRRLLTTRDQWGVALSQPLRVSKGEVDMAVPYQRDFEGNISKHIDRIGLRPAGTEYTLESFYRYPLNRAASLGAFVMLRQEPNHIQNAAMELTMLGTLRMQF